MRRPPAAVISLNGSRCLARAISEVGTEVGTIRAFAARAETSSASVLALVATSCALSYSFSGGSRRRPAGRAGKPEPFPNPFPALSIRHDLQASTKEKPAVSSEFPMERTGIEPVTSGLQS